MQRNIDEAFLASWLLNDRYEYKSIPPVSFWLFHNIPTEYNQYITSTFTSFQFITLSFDSLLIEKAISI